MPFISVIVPVYNRRSLLPRALRSLEAQTFRDFEVLIVDDGSEDGLEQDIARWISQHRWWRYLKHANRGVAWSRNAGIRAAFGEYVTFLDSDDEYLPDHLELRVKFMQQHPEVDVIHGGVELVGPEERHWVEDAYHPGRKIHISACCVGATLFGKRSVFLKAGGFPLVSYSSESRLLERLERHFVVRRVDFPTYRYHTEGDDRLCVKRWQERGGNEHA